jgi:hypothetical protein
VLFRLLLKVMYLICPKINEDTDCAERFRWKQLHCHVTFSASELDVEQKVPCAKKKNRSWPFVYKCHGPNNCTGGESAFSKGWAFRNENHGTLQTKFPMRIT